MFFNKNAMSEQEIKFDLENTIWDINVESDTVTEDSLRDTFFNPESSKFEHVEGLLEEMFEEEFGPDYTSPLNVTDVIVTEEGTNLEIMIGISNLTVGRQLQHVGDTLDERDVKIGIKAI